MSKIEMVRTAQLTAPLPPDPNVSRLRREGRTPCWKFWGLLRKAGGRRGTPAWAGPWNRGLSMSYPLGPSLWGSPVLGSCAGDGVLGLVRELQVVPVSSSPDPASPGLTWLEPALWRQRGKKVPNCQGKPSSAPEWKMQILYVQKQVLRGVGRPSCHPLQTPSVWRGAMVVRRAGPGPRSSGTPPVSALLSDGGPGLLGCCGGGCAPSERRALERGSFPISQAGAGTQMLHWLRTPGQEEGGCGPAWPGHK